MRTNIFLILLLSCVAFEAKSRDLQIESNADSSQDTIASVARIAKQAIPASARGKPSGVAPLDSLGLMNAAVSGNVDNAIITKSPEDVVRTISDKFSDYLSLKDIGVALDNENSETDIVKINELWKKTPRQTVFIPNSYWPSINGNAIVPATPSGNFVVQGLGKVHLWPSYPVTDHGIGFPAPYFGDGVTSILYGANSSVSFNRVDAHDIGFNSGLPNTAFNYVADTSKEPGNPGAPGMLNISIHTVAEKHKHGMESGVNDIFDSLSFGSYGDDDVQDWHHMGVYGTDWTWSNIREVNQYVPFYFSTKRDGVYDQATYINEEDFATGGPENSKGAYDPTQYNRKMFWLAHGYGTMGFGTVDKAGHKTAHIAGAVTWKPSTSYHRYQEIIVADSTGQPYTFYALSKDYNVLSGLPDNARSGASMPHWVFANEATVADGGVIWTCVGKFTADLGEVFGISGDNSPQTGWVARIGTLMSEDTDYIYNAIFDMSKAAFDPSVTHVFARMQKDMFLDLTADGTQAGQNNRLFGYGDGVGLEYRLSSSVNGARADTVPFAISDTGNTHISSLSIGNDSKKITDTRSIVFAENAEGGNPDHQMSLRASSSSAHLFADNMDLGKIITSVSVPKSSHAPCHAGEEAQDSKYFYKCVASNQWKRIAWDKENW